MQDLQFFCSYKDYKIAIVRIGDGLMEAIAYKEDPNEPFAVRKGVSDHVLEMELKNVIDQEGQV